MPTDRSPRPSHFPDDAAWERLREREAQWRLSDADLDAWDTGNSVATAPRHERGARTPKPRGVG